MYHGRNRYIDIITYNKSRVKLTNGVNHNVKPEGDYINACYVNSPFGVDTGSKIQGDRKIIASQGPLGETVNHFWQMIVENNVTMIVSTCKLHENGRSKCSRFWPKE
jgi:protein tyrosine phosphatase